MQKDVVAHTGKPNSWEVLEHQFEVSMNYIVRCCLTTIMEIII
jgi:hypothetical protein